MGSNSSSNRAPQSVHAPEQATQQKQTSQPQPKVQQHVSQPQPSQKPSEEKTDIKVKKVKLDRHVLERYLDLERQTRMLESKNVLKNHSMKQDQIKEYSETIQELEKKHAELVKQTAKEKADVDQMIGNPSIKSFFAQQSDYDAKLSQEQEEYLEALNKQEIAKKELDNFKKLLDQIKKESAELKKEADQVQKIYVEQDELLAGIFDGKYGSDLEYQLECQLDVLLDRKQRISVAKYKWQNGRLLLHHALQQMSFSVKKWEEVIRIPHMQARYTVATEVRNNLIAATQNITSAQRYLNTIEFPYCKQEEMMTLLKATSNIYTDMQSAERHRHATNCYVTTYKRAAALLQWFDHVIQNTIEKDLEKATVDCNVKTKELRKERLRLIKLKILESNENENLDIDGEMDLEDGPEPELQNLVTNADNVSEAGDTQTQSNAEPPTEANASAAAAEPQPSGPTPLPDSQLAPAPQSDKLFGDIDNIKKQHEKDMEEFTHAQDVNKARMEQGLQEKLKARRSRRARQDQQDSQQA